MKLPDGVVTFLFTDVEGSTRLWEDAPDAMMDALRLHDEKIEIAVDEHNGVSVKPRGEGDSRFVVFRGADDAVAAVAEIQRQLDGVEWPTPRPLRVRASLHTGLAELEMGDYYGSAVNRAARLRAIAHGGQTILSGATFELVQDRLPSGVTLSDMGRHRLKDLTRPERVYQMNVDGLDGSFPPLLSLDAVANNIPEQLTELIGREGELRDVEGLLEKTRLLTILAPGGTGKTRLAIQAAADHSSGYRDGVFFIPLADISSSEDIVQMVAEALGVALSSTDDPLDQLTGYLKSRRILFVLDNFEHVADGASIVSEVLRRAPEVSVIITSRARLNVQGETLFVLGGLDTTWDDADEALQVSGARLFVDAAQRARPDIALEPEDLDPLSRILELTGGLPLAILLAAAWVQVLSVSQIAKELARSLDILQTTMSDVPDRHRSMRAVFEYTWQQLGDRERSVFAALSVFRGGFSRDAAETVAGASLLDLSDLSGKSLITASDESGRYAVHELIRQYAESELEEDSERCEAVLDSHAAFFSELANSAFAFLSSADQPKMLRIMEDDLENIRLAWRRSISNGDAGGVRKISLPLFYLYEVRGWYQSGSPLFGEAIEAFDSDSQTGGVVGIPALMTALQAWFLSLLGQQEMALPKAIAAVAELRGAKDDEALWIGLQCLALSLAYSGEDWSEIAEEGLALGERMDGPYWMATFKNWRAGAASNAGELDLGGRLLSEGREVLERLDEHLFLGMNLGHHGTIAARQGDIEEAINLNTRSVVRSRGIGHLRSLQLSLTGLGVANLEIGDFDAAEEALIEDLAISERMGLIRELLQVLIQLARVRSATGRAGEAVELLATVIAEPMSSNQTVWETSSLKEIAVEEVTELESSLDSAESSSRREAGTAKPYQVAVKELLDQQQMSPPVMPG
jgi:predicted ATPase/class 3 adenylate cyclase